MAKYRIIDAETVYNTFTQASASVNDIEYMTWLTQGNTPDPAEANPQYTSQSRLEARVTTTDATPTMLFQERLAANVGYAAGLTLIAVDTGNGNCHIWKVSLAAKRIVNTVSFIGTPTILAEHEDAGAASWDVNAVFQGQALVIRVVGQAGREISWNLVGSFYRFGPNGIFE